MGCNSLPAHISTVIVMIDVDMSAADPTETCRLLGTATIDDDEAQATAALFKALSDPARIKIVNLLARSGEPVCACEFMPALGLAQATVSHHLKKLTEAGLLEREQRGKWAFFSLDDHALARLAELVEPDAAAVR
jgi:ArsR family transcriptional regulator